jgi:hypothetical protein
MSGNPYCEMVKCGKAPKEDFPAFLRHTGECRDCQRRIYSQMLVQFNQKLKET